MATGNSPERWARLREVDLDESDYSKSTSKHSKSARRIRHDRSPASYARDVALIEEAAIFSQQAPQETPQEFPPEPARRGRLPECDSDSDSNSDSDSEPSKPAQRLRLDRSPASYARALALLEEAAIFSQHVPQQARQEPSQEPREPVLNRHRGHDSDFGSSSGCSKPPQSVHFRREDPTGASGAQAEAATQEPEPAITQRPKEPALEDQEHRSPPSPLRYRPFAPYEAAGANIAPPAYVDQHEDGTGAHDFVMPDGWMAPTPIPTAAELNRDLMARRDGWVWVPTEIAPAYHAPVPPMYPVRDPEFVPVEMTPNHRGNRFAPVPPPFPVHAPDFAQGEQPPGYRGDPFAPIPPPFPIRAPDAVPVGHGSPFASVPPSFPVRGSDSFTGWIPPAHHRQGSPFAPVLPPFPVRGPSFMAPRGGPYSPIVRFFMPTPELGPSSFQSPPGHPQPPTNFQPPPPTTWAHRVPRRGGSEPPYNYQEAIWRQEEELERAWRQYDEQCIGHPGQGQRRKGNTSRPLVAATGSPSSARSHALPHRPRR